VSGANLGIHGGCAKGWDGGKLKILEKQGGPHGPERRGGFKEDKRLQKVG